MSIHEDTLYNKDGILGLSVLKNASAEKEGYVVAKIQCVGEYTFLTLEPDPRYPHIRAKKNLCVRLNLPVFKGCFVEYKDEGKEINFYTDTDTDTDYTQCIGSLVKEEDKYVWRVCEYSVPNDLPGQTPQKDNIPKQEKPCLPLKQEKEKNPEKQLHPIFLYYYLAVLEVAHRKLRARDTILTILLETQKFVQRPEIKEIRGVLTNKHRLYVNQALDECGLKYYQHNVSYIKRLTKAFYEDLEAGRIDGEGYFVRQVYHLSEYSILRVVYTNSVGVLYMSPSTATATEEKLFQEYGNLSPIALSKAMNRLKI